MDFYKMLAIEKKERKLTNEAIGAFIGMEGETFRMAVVRQSLDDLQVKEIKRIFDSNKNSKIKSNTGIGVPYYDLDFTSSFLEIVNDQSTKPDMYIDHPFFRGCDFVVRNSGQSMAKLICHGDAIGLVRLHNWKEFFPFGEVYAIVTNDGFRMIKVITKGETEDCYTLLSKPTDSKKDEFPPQQIKKSSILSIFKVQASSHLF